MKDTTQPVQPIDFDDTLLIVSPEDGGEPSQLKLEEDPPFEQIPIDFPKT